MGTEIIGTYSLKIGLKNEQVNYSDKYHGKVNAYNNIDYNYALQRGLNSEGMKFLKSLENKCRKYTGLYTSNLEHLTPLVLSL